MDVFTNPPAPSPALSVQDVIKIQLDALQNNDIYGGDRGIRIAFRFASPQNQMMTGPVEHFIEMVKNPLYDALIGFERAELGELRGSGDAVQQVVRLHHRHGPARMYLFTLSRQGQGMYQGCWMTDSVIPQG